MKPRIVVVLLLAVIQTVAHSQPGNYTGKVKLIHKAPASIERYYANQLTLTVQPGGKAQAMVEIKQAIGSKQTIDKGYYCRYNGTLHGTFSDNILQVTGSLSVEMEDDEEAINSTEEAEIKGTLINGVINGTITISKKDFYSFSIAVADALPELQFPLGNSPKVFDKGWLFAASFKINGNNNEEIDLSEQIEWSGSGSFEPGTGASSRPAFSSVGENKIILTAEYEGKKYSKEYKVTTVDADRYARIGSMAKCPADGHGCMGDPFPVLGTVMTGNANVLINGLPVACEGDRGRHASCAGPNTFFISGGDDEVLLNGKRVAKAGSQTTHCGGMGNITSVESAVADGFAALSKDVSFTDKQGNKIESFGKPAAGTKMSTGPNGLVLMNPDRNTVMMVLPECNAVITSNDEMAMSVMLEKGQVFVNSEKAENNKQLLIETFNEKLVKKGTRFLFSHSKDSSRLIVYEGEVEVTLKGDNSTVLVPAGKVYFNDFKNPYSITDTLEFQAAAQLMNIPKDSAYWQLPKPETTTTPTTNENQPVGFLELLKKYWYVGAGVLVLIVLMVVVGKRKRR